MAPDTNRLTDADLRVRRESLRQGLIRANMATVAMVLLALGLAIASILLALRSQSDRLRAEHDRANAESLLYETSLAPVRAQRLIGRMGQRLRSLEAVEVAARIRPSAELREQAISALALVDIEDAGIWRTVPSNAVHVAVDPSFERYAHVTEPHTIVVQGLDDQAELYRVRDPTTPEPNAVFFGASRFLLSDTPLGIHVWNATNGTPVFSLTVTDREARIVHRVVAPVPAVLASTDARGVLRVVDLETGSMLWEHRGLDRPGVLSFDPAGNLLAVECRQEMQVWDWRARRWVARLRHDYGSVTVTKWQPDGAGLWLGCGNRMIYAWDLLRNQAGALGGHTREIVNMIPHPTEPLFVSYAWDNTLRVWDGSSGNALLQASGMIPLCFGPDGRRLAVWKQGRGIGLMNVIGSGNYRTLGATPGLSTRFNTIDFDRNSSRVAAADAGGVVVWNTVTGQRRASVAVANCQGAWFEGDDSLIVVHAGGIERRGLETNTATGRLELRVVSEIPVDRAMRLGSSGMDTTRRRLASHIDGTDRGAVIDTSTGQVEMFLDGQPGFTAPTFSPDGRWIASGCWHPTINRRMTAAVWDAASGRMITNFPSTKCTVTFSADSRWLLLGAGPDYTLIETDSWREVRRFERSEAMVDFGYAAFAPRSEALAIHATDRILRLVDPDTGTEWARLGAPDTRILKALAYSPDGRFLAAATEGNMQLWDLRNLRAQLAALRLDWAGSGGGLGSGPVGPSVDSGWIWVVIPAVFGAILLAVALALLMLRHQRQVLLRYQEVDGAIAQRNEQLAAAQQELLHSQKMRALGTLAAGIAHDFNNLLSVIRVSNKLMSRRGKDDPVIAENSGEIEQAVRQGKSVVQSMLGYTREDLDKQTPFSLAELVEDAVALLSKQFLSGLTLTLDLDRSAPLVNLPRARIEQVLLNLIVNASEAMDGHGKLSLTVRAIPRPSGARILEPADAPSYVELKVADSGPGIPAEVLPRVFEPFFTTKTLGASRGTGLGLSMVYGAAREHGLGIGVESEPGHGTRFSIFIPARNDLPAPSAPGRDSRIPVASIGALQSSPK